MSKRFHRFVLVICCIPGLVLSGSPGKIVRLRCEYQIDPVGIGILKPRLSWQLSTDARQVRQSAYQIQAAASVKDLEASENLLWDSGQVLNDRSVHVVYGGPVPGSGTRIFWRVRIWDQDTTPWPWSETAFWETGLLSEKDWTAEWIRPDLKEDPDQSNPSPMLRKEFKTGTGIRSARLYITALGLVEARINGKRVGDQVFTPGWTSYDNRIQFQTYDITDLLHEGANAIGVILGDGWYRGRMGWEHARNIYGGKLALLAQMHIDYGDGHTEKVMTDESWKSDTGPIRYSDIYDGEAYDARLEQAGWADAGFDDSGWKKSVILDHRHDILCAPQGPPVRKTEELRPVQILYAKNEDKSGIPIFDMGQNMTGWVRLRVSGPRGTTVTLRHAEVLDRYGSLYTDNLRSAQQTVRYTLKGTGEEVFEPHFTFQGFRYVAVEGLPDKPDEDNITGIVIHSDMEPTGQFSCSDDMLNRLVRNIQWGQRGNFLDVPTDCPQRDERMGWTGDAQVFCPTACFNFNAAGFFTKWLKDVAADQQSSGSVPYVVPNVLSHGQPEGASGAAGWADVAVIIPWTLYEIYGDVRILREQYDSMKAWVEYQRRRAGDSFLWTQDFTFGDWLAFNTTRSDYPGATTDKDLISSAFFAHTADILSKTARVLGYVEDAREYADLVAKIQHAFAEEYITSTGRLASNTQTAYTLALAFGLVPESLRKSAAARLAEDVRRFGHITTGFLGTPLICHVLSSNGYSDEAFMLLNRKEYPSWLYPVTMGATTIWERWDGIKPDSTFQDSGMNSLNHYAYGAIEDWMVRFIAGINPDPEQPGYKHTIIAPHTGGGLTSAAALLESVHGLVRSEWRLDRNRMEVRVQVPPNTTATILLPDARLSGVKENGRPVQSAEGILDCRESNGDVRLEIGSGQYRFVYPWMDKDE
ncbi:family 78 glycoside hydrolase catalytic domain [bacterium]|nr:family 78 glycoside hydrolase catalytic domain [bacterium]